MNLFQPKRGYRYNSDTLLLYDFISSFHPKGQLLDVGCGCGILGLLLKRDFPRLHVSLLDIQFLNCEIAKANAKANLLAIENITCKDFLEATFEHKWDMIVSNPPFYHKGGVQNEDNALFLSRHSSALPFAAFAQKVSKTLSNRGYFCFCYDAKQIDHVMASLLGNGLNVEDLCFVYPKEEKEASLVLIRARKNSKTLCKIHPPLFIYTGEHISVRVKAIFERSATKSCEWMV
ncbi:MULTISPECIES: methyltransferase [unclassified Sulfurospirillum]|uniref:tRNA1(Val) (adenine(37)-N6)-methyltransferase n=1 Tax=unclassified Sulfurospirillum TaxID=2618290 RepID=UPI0005059341|nr:MULTISPECIES: methyltransferase [unclassified Sulfurospirillum]KFL35216.1 methyltransferase [Sulfurospirillum sp. SCADC]